MTTVVSDIISMCANLVIFGMIPFIWWLIFWRKKENFFHWLGFFKPKLMTKVWVALAFIVLYLFFYYFDWTIFLDADTIAYLTENAASANSDTTGRGLAAISEAIFVNFIGNGIAEEV